MMEEAKKILEGCIAFLGTGLLLVVVTEMNIFIENILSSRAELRKGFFKKLVFRIHYYLRRKFSLKDRLFDVLTFLPVFLALALLPGYQGKPLFSIDHSLIFSILALMSAPLINFYLHAQSKVKANETYILKTHERAICASGLLFIVLVLIALVTGSDSLEELTKIQQSGSWLIFLFPMMLPLFLITVVLAYYISVQKLFSKAESHSEGTKQTTFLNYLKSTWLFFSVTLFCGGGGIFLIPKILSVGLLAGVFGGMWGRLREDQAESVVLWDLAPMALFLLLISVALVGVRI